MNGMALNVPKYTSTAIILLLEEVSWNLRPNCPRGRRHARAPIRYERLDEAELGCVYLVGFAIVHIEEEDRPALFEFYAPRPSKEVLSLLGTDPAGSTRPSGGLERVALLRTSSQLLKYQTSRKPCGT